MLKSLIVLSALAFAGTANAASVSCSSSFLDYRLSLKTTVSGMRVGSRANLVVTKGGSPLRSATLPMRSGRFVAGQSLVFLAEGSDGRAEVNATFASGRTYTGSLAVSAAEGSTTVSTTCTVR